MACQSPGRGCCRFTDGILAHLSTPGGPTGLRNHHFESLGGGVGGAALRGVPLSRSIEIELQENSAQTPQILQFQSRRPP